MNDLVFEWPQITMIALLLPYMLIVAALHGKKQQGEHNIFISLFALAGNLAILYYGGFFTETRP